MDSEYTSFKIIKIPNNNEFLLYSPVGIRPYSKEVSYEEFLREKRE